MGLLTAFEYSYGSGFIDSLIIFVRQWIYCKCAMHEIKNVVIEFECYTFLPGKLNHEFKYILNVIFQ